MSAIGRVCAIRSGQKSSGMTRLMEDEFTKVDRKFMWVAYCVYRATDEFICDILVLLGKDIRDALKGKGYAGRGTGCF